MTSTTGPSLLEFVTSEAFVQRADPVMKTTLLSYLLDTDALPQECWARVIAAVQSDPMCSEVVVSIVSRLVTADHGVGEWATNSIEDKTLPLALRVRVYLAAKDRIHSSAVLCEELRTAVLAGLPCSSAALDLLDPEPLWKAALAANAYLCAAALVAHKPDVCQHKTPELLAFLSQGLCHPKKMQRRCCLKVLQQVYPKNSALLTLLSEQQPLHLIVGAEDCPAELHDAAMHLALQHGDKRILESIFPLLAGLSSNYLLGVLLPYMDI